MKKMFLLVLSIFILFFSTITNAYIFSYPNVFYLDGMKFTTNSSFFKQFYNHTPEYLRDNLEIDFNSHISYFYGGYTYCFDNNRIKIIIPLNGWIQKDYNATLSMLEHELKHAYQCRVLGGLPKHNGSLKRIRLR